MKKLATLLATASFALAAPASAVVINASGEGWCNSTSACNNTSTTSLANTFAGATSAGSALYRDWFYFNIPVGTWVSATLSIHNAAANSSSQPTTVYTSFAASGITYAGLGSGTALGSVTVGAANTGVSHYVDITLNGSALSLLNTSSGSGFLFGGSINGTNTTTNQLFGYTTGTPVATLTLVSATAIPEPESWALIMLGFAALGAVMRRKQPAARVRLSYS
jgi:PEP-CTERM motif